VQLLGEMLINDGVIIKEVLEQALETQRKEGGLLGMILLDNGFISEQDLVEALIKQGKIPDKKWPGLLH
nr:hypothetical protein [Spirochaetota bacterium]